MRILLASIFILIFLYLVSAYRSREGKWRQQNRQYANRRSISGRFTKVFQWKQLDYQFPNQQIRQQAIQNGTFVEKNSAMPLSLQADKSRLFVSVPRWRQGVPSTLNYVPLANIYNETATSPQLIPYPNLEFNRQGNCEGATSVFRMFADHCDRLWVVDTGTIGNQQVCPPQILAFDLKTDKVIYTHRFSEDVLRLRCNAQPTNIAVDYPREQCGQTNNKPDAFLYVTDTAGYAIIVIDIQAEKSWRVLHRTMFPSPEAGTFRVSGQQFDLMDGVLGLALGPVAYSGNEKNLYYNPMTSFNHFWVPTSLLKTPKANSTNFRSFQSGLTQKNSQSAGCGIDSRGVLFFGLLNEDAIACWNTQKSYEPKNHAVLAKSASEMQFLSTVVVDPYDRVWALSTRFQRFFTKTMDPEEINFRVFTASASKVVRGTICEQTTLGESAVRGRA